MQQRLELLRTYLRQPDIPPYAITEARSIASGLALDYEGYGEVPGALLVEHIQAGRKKEAFELLDEIRWLLSGGDSTGNDPVDVPDNDPVDETVTEAMRRHSTLVDVSLAILDQNAKTCAKAIAETTNIDVLNALAETEGAGKQRKTVFEAIENRRNILLEESAP